MKYETIFLGKTKDSFLSTGIAEYSKRLSHYTDHSIKLLKNKKKGQSSTAKVKEDEGQYLLSNVTAGAYIVALDFGGKQYSSEQFADLISGWERRSIKKVCFLIGGPDGLSDEVKNRADMLFSLSNMTFTHDMVRLFLLEQLYRAYTIKAGEKYHK